MMRRVVMAVGHRGGKIIVGWVVASMVLSLLVSSSDGHRNHHNWWAFAPELALMMGFVACWYLHDEGLCEKCMADFPLNAPEVAEKKKRKLWLHHRLNSPGGITFVMGSIVLSMVMDWLHVLEPWNVLGSVPWLAVMVVGMTHRKYSPWCPECREDGGDDDEEKEPVGPGGDGIEEPR